MPYALALHRLGFAVTPVSDCERFAGIGLILEVSEYTLTYVAGIGDRNEISLEDFR